MSGVGRENTGSDRIKKESCSVQQEGGEDMAGAGIAPACTVAATCKVWAGEEGQGKALLASVGQGKASINSWLADGEYVV